MTNSDRRHTETPALIRTLIVGVGVRGRQWAAVLRSAAGYELVGCVDIDPLARAQAIHDFGIPEDRCFIETGEALERVSADAVIVATPPGNHRAACEMALLHDRAVLVEKPFTMLLADAVELVALADRRRRPLLVAHNYRYMRAFRAAKLVIDSGALGRVGLVHFQYYRVPHAMVPSLSELTLSILWGAGVHHLDLLTYLTNDRVTGVGAQAVTLPWGQLPHGASIGAVLSFASGAQAMYSATYESRGHEFFERGQEFYARVIGERATLHITHRWLFLCEGRKLPRLVRRGRRTMSEEQVLLDHLSQAIRTGGESPSGGRDNLQTMAIVEAFRRSAVERRWFNPQELLHESVEAASGSGHRD